MRINGPCRVAVVVLLVSGIKARAQTAAPTDDRNPGVYVAEVSGDDVYVRSGPSTNYYPVVKLAAGTRVRVVGKQGDWLTIDPPASCFSLIHKNFVDVDPDAASGEGVVNGDAVLVRAGSLLSPQLSSKQLKLNRGATVHVLKAHNEDYLRIVPPKGAHVFISARFVNRLPAARTVERTAGTATAEPAKAEAGTKAPTTTAKAKTPPDPKPGSLRDKIEAADALLAAEEKKPLLHRDFTEVIAQFEALSNQEVDAYARSYALARLVQLRDASETLALVKALRESGEALTADRKSALQTRERMRPPLPKIGGGFDAVGELRTSMIYGSTAYPPRYRLVGSDGLRTIGYVEIPKGSGIDVTRFLGRRVGVRSRETRLQTEDVDPLMIYVASELVLLDVSKGDQTTGESAVSREPSDG